MVTKINKTPASEVYGEDVVTSGLIPNLDPTNLLYIGKNWFKDNATGTAYHFVKNETGMVSVKETRQSKSSTKASLKTPDKPKPKKPATTEIKCMDCGATRVIKVQDAFQVKRCIPCQIVYRHKHRTEKNKAKKEASSPLGKV